MKKADAEALKQGSSPLTRGKLTARHRVHRHVGLIPAHAGKTRPPRLKNRRARAHPRSRGENFSSSAGAAGTAGSSPLTRGKHDQLRPSREPRGLIPAHAGKTSSQVSQGRCVRAHPRSRGENGPRPQPGVREGGSSPLTRGKRHALRPRIRDRGLIPAHAGKTRWPTPRPTMPEGSSPLTRGKPDRAARPGQVLGLIPAHAGKTISPPSPRFQFSAHPRSRGENAFHGHKRRPNMGSSPLTRGKPRNPIYF